MSEARPRPRRLSELVGSLQGQGDVAIGRLVDTLGERAFGALMFIFAVPNVIPTPPGTSAVLGLPLVILTFQLTVGRQAIWLPEVVRQRTIKSGLIDGFVARAVPVLKRFEKVLRPRLAPVVQPNVAEKLIGLVAFLLAIVLFLPIPFANILPAAAIAVLALGLAERDGIATLVGYALSAASFVILAVVSTALIAAAKTFLRVLFGWF